VACVVCTVNSLVEADWRLDCLPLLEVFCVAAITEAIPHPIRNAHIQNAAAIRGEIRATVALGPVALRDLPSARDQKCEQIFGVRRRQRRSRPPREACDDLTSQSLGVDPMQLEASPEHGHGRALTVPSTGYLSALLHADAADRLWESPSLARLVKTPGWRPAKGRLSLSSRSCL
jgi:hypothetical protein